MTSTWHGTLPETPPTSDADLWEPPTSQTFRTAPTPPPPPPTPSSPPPRRGGGWRAAAAVFGALALVGGGYMVRDLTDSTDNVAPATSALTESPTSSLPSGTTPALTTTGNEPVADVAAAVSPAVVQIQAWLGYFNRWRFAAVENLALYWSFSALAWLVVLAVVYLSPRLL